LEAQAQHKRRRHSVAFKEQEEEEVPGLKQKSPQKSCLGNSLPVVWADHLVGNTDGYS